ncbi:type III-B CRISPR module-associated protein Cmr5 [Massilibacterium senegalense]|uniref:type III-B CRISPR module-associated protein Cmr5 n=1 Tax=Massilibacterium senegalense TaxID=1632858 RepID=UPI0007866AED|nr:type III-B CRISPR module-associated protein Cmr5 [Massilibacterium senegalense]
MKNIQNERAAFAYEKVLALHCKSEFATIARSMPAKIQMTGLATTVAFLFAKKKELYDLLTEWLRKRKLLGDEELMEAITKVSITEYRVMTNEVQQLLIWVKRFAEGMIKDVEV